MADNTITGAASAYQNASMRTARSAEEAARPDFSDMVSQSLDQTVDSINRSETATTQALLGNISLDELALAVSNADLALRTVVSIRDKVVAAYQDISKMPI